MFSTISSPYIFNKQIQSLRKKYINKDLFDIKLLKKIENNMTFEIILIFISCDIEELKDIFSTIPQLDEVFVDRYGQKLNIHSYINTHNKEDCWKIANLFNVDYYLKIEIYKDNFLPFNRVESDAILEEPQSDMNYLIINLENLTFY